MSLNELGLKYGTDKGTRHSYLDIYEKLFSKYEDKPISLLELGVCDGKSIRMWLEYFPKAMIYGFDNDSKNSTIWDSSRYEFFLADQSNESILNLIGKSAGLFDIIIDDAEHDPIKQILSFHYLWQFVSAGGYYIIEDIRTEEIANYWNIPGAIVFRNHKNGVEDDILVVIKKDGQEKAN